MHIVEPNRASALGYDWQSSLHSNFIVVFPRHAVGCDNGVVFSFRHRSCDIIHQDMSITIRGRTIRVTEQTPGHRIPAARVTREPVV